MERMHKFFILPGYLFCFLCFYVQAALDSETIVITPKFIKEKSFKNSPAHPGQLRKYPQVAVVLGGGGARGLCHIGVLKVLDNAGIPVDIVVGTSMGSVVGALYAAGESGKELEEMALTVDWTDIFHDKFNRERLFYTQKYNSPNHLLEMRIKNRKFALPVALTSGQKIANFFTQRTFEAACHSGNDFDRLPNRFRSICTDFVAGKKKAFNHGIMAKIIRASMAVPFAFTPVSIDGRPYVDGGMCDNLPIETALSMGADYIIAINVKPGLR
ncbi:MAG: patatin-like phospholipase family protein, partial [bacterium]